MCIKMFIEVLFKSVKNWGGGNQEYNKFVVVYSFNGMIIQSNEKITTHNIDESHKKISVR